MSESELEVVETHISRLLFVGDRVLKWYRPLDNGFLDHRDVAARRAACEQEVELNRRFAPDVYLDVVSVRGSGGDEIEPAVLMRRLPEQRRLSSLLGSADAVAGIRDIARVVAAVHAGSSRSETIDRTGTVDAVESLWVDNLRSMLPFEGSILAAGTVEQAAERARLWVRRRADVFAARIRDGWVVDGHGDLLCNDIFLLDDGPRILDCLAFRDDFRYGDVVADLAFLVMDLEYRGHPELAELLVCSYGEFSGHPVPRGLLHAWTAHRAFVRAKVACLRSTDHGDDEAGQRDEARTLFELGVRHQHQARPLLVVVGGPPGVGKSTVAAALGDRLGAAVLRTDEIRKELAGIDPLTSARAAPGHDLYGTDHTRDTYDEMLRRAEVLLACGESAVLDASWSTDAERGAARQLAIAGDSRLLELRCDAPAEVADARIWARSSSGSDASDATAEVAEWMRQRFEPWPEAIVVNTTDPTERLIEGVLAGLRWTG